MIRPFTCVCLILAAGSGLYLYQVKQRAFALDAELRGTFHAIDVARDRTRMLRADWALMNDPERLQALATQYLQLQPMAPSQLMTMDQLAAALPAPIPPGSVPAAAPDASKSTPAIDPTQGMPMAAAAPRVLPHTSPAPEVALLQPVSPAPPDPPALAVPPPPSVAATAPAPVFTPEPAAPEPAVPQPPAPQALAPLPAAIAIAPLPKIVAAPAPKPVHHWVRHTAPAPSPQPALADANTGATDRAHRVHHKAAPPPAQFYAVNEPARLPEASPRITPPAATVMYSPASGSSLGMAASAALAPPRPLYSTAQ
jgi:hypothetical protein